MSSVPRDYAPAHCTGLSSEEESQAKELIAKIRPGTTFMVAWFKKGEETTPEGSIVLLHSSGNDENYALHAFDKSFTLVRTKEYKGLKKIVKYTAIADFKPHVPIVLADLKGMSLMSTYKEQPVSCEFRHLYASGSIPWASLAVPTPPQQPHFVFAPRRNQFWLQTATQQAGPSPSTTPTAQTHAQPSQHNPSYPANPQETQDVENEERV